tara:strand:- start:3 stop:200 length:198 start_codon:yes stop_codon:yes gene_type:complete
MKWLDLYKFMYNKANKLSNVGTINWQEDVEIYDCETGTTYKCDMLELDENKKLTLSINMDSIYQE